MEADVIKRRSSPAASFKTYSKRRTEQPPRKKRRLSDLSIPAIKPQESLERPQGSTSENNGSTEERHGISEQLQDNGVNHTHKKRRDEDPADTAIRSEGSIEVQEGIVRQKPTSDPVILPEVIIEDKQSLIHTTSPNTASTKQPQSTTKLAIPPLLAEDSIEQPKTAKIQKSSIQNYFKPVQVSSAAVSILNSSSPNSTPSIYSDPQAASSTPPSSPPSSKESPEESKYKSQRRARRRLTTKPLLPPINMPPQPSPGGSTSADNGSDNYDATGLADGSVTINGVKVEAHTFKVRSNHDNTKIVTQTYLSIPNAIKICPRCDYPIDKSIRGEILAHEKCCDSVAEGSIKRTPNNKEWTEENGHQRTVLLVDRNSSDNLRAQAERAMRVSKSELDGVIPEPAELWSEIDDGRGGKLPRYKVAIHTIAGEAMAVVLAETINMASGYGNGPDNKERVLTAPVFPVIVCIDRIWVFSPCRRRGFAKALVDEVRASFVYGMRVPKEQIAFSIPTSLGFEFATAYCKDVDYAGNTDIKFLVNPADVPSS